MKKKIRKCIAMLAVVSMMGNVGCMERNTQPEGVAQKLNQKLDDSAAKMIGCIGYTLADWEEKQFLNAVDKWEKSQSMYSMNYRNEGLAAINTQTLQKVSSDLMAGKDGAMIEMTRLPYNAYMEKGALYPIDLNTEIVEGLYPMIRQMCEKDGKLMMIPTGVHFPVLRVNKDFVKSVEQEIDLTKCTITTFLEIAKQIQETLPENMALFPKDSEGYLATYIMQLFYHDAIVENTPITKESLEALIQTLETLKSWEHPYYTVEEVYQNDRGEKDEIVFMVGFYTAFGSEEDFAMYPMPLSDTGYYYATPRRLFGIISEEGKKGVEDLLGYLLSEEEQTNNMFDTLPVSSAYTARYKENYCKKIGNRAVEEAERQIQQLETLMGLAQGFASTNLGYKAIEEQINAYLGGKQSKDQAITAILRYMTLNKY